MLHRYLMHKAASDEPDQADSISLPEAAGDWYDNVYLPVVDAVRQMDVIKHFPGRSETDLYEWLVRHQSEIRRQHDLQEIKLPATAQEFLQSLETST